MKKIHFAAIPCHKEAQKCGMTAKQYMNHKEQLRAAFAAALGFPPSDVHLFRIILFARGGRAA